MGSGNTNRLNLQAQQIDKRSKRQGKKKQKTRKKIHDSE